MKLVILLCLFLSVSAEADISINKKNIGLSNWGSYEDLRNTGFTPRKDLASWALDYPLDWDADPYSDENWKFQYHAWRMIDPIIKRYTGGDDELLNEILITVDDWYFYHVTAGKSSDYQWYDMSTGLRAMKLAWLWSVLEECGWCYGDKDKIQYLLEIHIEKLMTPELLAAGNHAYFQLVGLRLACRANPDILQCEKEEKYSVKNMSLLLKEQFSDEYVHLEHSPKYHLFTLKIIQSLNIANLFGGEVGKIIEGAGAVSPWLIYPDNTVARIGDSAGNYRSKVPNAPLFNVADRSYLVGDYSESGYFTLRTPPGIDTNESSQIFITGMSNLGLGPLGHKHADELSFELFHRGKLVFIDSGKYSYNYDEYRKYVLSAAAHNTLSVSYDTIKKTDVDRSGSKLTGVNISEKDISISGLVERPGYFKHTRYFKLIPFEKLIVKDEYIGDIDLETRVKSLFGDYAVTSNLHLNPELEVMRHSKNIIEIEGYATIEMISDDCTLTLRRGEKKPLLGWASFSYNNIIPTNVVQAYCQNIFQGKLEWHITLI